MTVHILLTFRPSADENVVGAGVPAVVVVAFVVETLVVVVVVVAEALVVVLNVVEPVPELSC